MALTTKPTIKNVWATTGLKVEPSDGKMAAGWIVERPPHQFQNYLQHRVDSFIKHVNEAGIAAWDAETVYTAGKSYVQGSDGKIYKCLVDGFNQNPVGNASYWVLTFGDLAVQEYANNAEAAAIEAEASAVSADESATNAEASESAAAASASSALTSANNADTSEANAAASAAAALASQNAAATSETNAETAYTGSQDIWEDLQVLLEDGPVISVNGQVGTVTLTKADIGLSLVANIDPPNLPISTATADALGTKQPALGYTPVQQGTGTDQHPNVIKIGWNNTEARLKATVDTTNLGNIVFDSQTVWEKVADVVPTAGVTVVSVALPSTYRLFRIQGIGLVPASGDASNNLYSQVTIGGTVRTGASDYFTQRVTFFNTTVQAAGATENVLALASGGNQAVPEKTEFEMTLFPGETTTRGSALILSRGLRNDGVRSGYYGANEILVVGRVEAIRFGWVGGTTFTAKGRIIIEGLRA
jgi:hypothetical protein